MLNLRKMEEEVFGEKKSADWILKDSPGRIPIPRGFRLSMERGEKSLSELWKDKCFLKLVGTRRKHKKKEKAVWLPK